MKADLFGDLKAAGTTADSHRRRDLLTFRGNVKEGRHGWLRLTPAYSLHVVREILQERAPGDFVLDPFSGTGTTPLAGAELGVRTHAVDVNPFLVWFGNVKVSRFEPSMRSELCDAAAEIISELHGGEQPGKVWTPPIHQIEK